MKEIDSEMMNEANARMGRVKAKVGDTYVFRFAMEKDKEGEEEVKKRSNGEEMGKEGAGRN
jgi:hypothetical protein